MQDVEHEWNMENAGNTNHHVVRVFTRHRNLVSSMFDPMSQLTHYMRICCDETWSVASLVCFFIDM